MMFCGFVYWGLLVMSSPQFFCEYIKNKFIFIWLFYFSCYIKTNIFPPGKVQDTRCNKRIVRNVKIVNLLGHIKK